MNDHNLLNVNDLKDVSPVIDPTMFADDTNLFFTHSDIEKLFLTMNQELASISEWYASNKLYFNAKKRQHIIPFSINPIKKMRFLSG